ncbi:unnamed protein product, partial [Gordionus sp. m RMFG-2023]
ALSYEKCDEPFGLESGKISNNAITASTSLSSIKLPHHARLNKDTAWTSSNTDINQYLQIDLESTKQITSIVTQGRPNTLEFVSEFLITYSENNKEWIHYKDQNGIPKVFKGNYDSQTSVRNNFYPPIIARFIRINPQKWYLYISLRVELFGCDYQSNVISFSGNGDLIRYNISDDQIHRTSEVIRLRFLTSYKDGILMHSPGSQGDLIFLELRDSKLRLYVKLGDNHEVSLEPLTVGNLLDDNRWHDVMLERNGKNLTMTVDQMKNQSLIPGSFSLLDLDNYITFGGIYLPPTAKNNLAISSQLRGFKGCVDNILINDINIIYETRKNAKGFETLNNPGDMCRIKKSPAVTFTLPEANFEWPALDGISALNISLEFRTFHSNGLLAHHKLGGAGGYISLLLAKGRITLTLRVASQMSSPFEGIVNLANLYSETSNKQSIDPFENKHFNDGIWHRVTLYIKTNEILLDVDQWKSLTRRKIDIRTGKSYQIGGGVTPDEDPGYLGCIRSLYLDSRMIPLASLTPKDISQGISIDACTIVDRCTPNPCLHEGVCTQDWFDFYCVCDGTGYTGPVCHSSIHPLSCEAYKQRRNLYSSPSTSSPYHSNGFEDSDTKRDEYKETGYKATTSSAISLTGTSLIIDMDGSGPAKPFRVVCDFSENSSPHRQNLDTGSSLTQTILSHNFQWERNMVTGYPEAGSYKQRLYYEGMGDDPYLLDLFVNRSLSCKQNIKYECLMARLMNSPNWNTPMSWWVSRHNQPMYYWGGAPSGSGKCACGVKQNCIDKDKYCNCDSYKPYLTEDSGFITEKEHLPVVEIAIGDTGTLAEDRKAYYTVGPLLCTGDQLFENVVTFKRAKAILTFPPLIITDSGDIQFEFKTSHLSAVFFENLGTDGTITYFRLKLIDGRKLQLEFNTGDGNRILTIMATDSFNNNEWHLVNIEWSKKEVRFWADSYRPESLSEMEANFKALKLTRKFVIGGKADMTDGYIGCMRVFTVNGQLLDLVSKVEAINSLLNSHRTPGLSHKKELKNMGILVGCMGACRISDNYPCQNNGTCYEMWSYAKCDCAWTAFRGPYCTEDVGAHLNSEMMITYRFPNELGTLTTISEHMRVAFSTLEFQGILLEVTSYSGDFISLQLQNNGGLKIRFNFGYEPQEINDDRQVYANGQFHEVHVWRRDGGSTIELQVDDYEPKRTKYQTGLSQDTKFNDLKAIYIGRNETTPPGKGFTGCISRVEFEDHFPLKEVFSSSNSRESSNSFRSASVLVTGSRNQLVEDMCNVVPETPFNAESQTEDFIFVKGQVLLERFARAIPKYVGVKMATIIALAILIVIVSMFVVYFVAKFYTRHKGDYLTQEDAGAKDSIDADTAIMKSPIGQIDTLQKEWFF